MPRKAPQMPGADVVARETRSAKRRRQADSGPAQSEKNLPRAQLSTSGQSNSEPQTMLSLHQRIKDNTRVTKDYYFFHGGPLSNWYTKGTPFKGEEAMKILIPLLDAAGLAYPLASEVTTQLLERHYFVCGEQWMMACKAWLMEANIEFVEAQTVPGGMEAFFGEIKKTIPSNSLSPQGQRVHGSTLAQIIRSSNPRDQKRLGKEVRNFDEKLWEKARVPIVVAGTYARANVTPMLRDIYMDNFDLQRKFCEGSPSDTIWGVGIRWNNRAIDDPRHWRGTNLLGLCHDEACRMMVETARAKLKEEPQLAVPNQQSEEGKERAVEGRSSPNKD